MNPAAALAWLYGAQHHGIKLGLENIERLVAALEIDLTAQKFLHVAGTNGKGSVCAMMASIARAAGLHVGLYTSPHLVEFGERIQIDGENISLKETLHGISALRHAVEGWDQPATFFELATALAFRHFAQAKLDLVVLETGMGGRLDATNIVRPLVSVITRIDLDHQPWLGHSLREIAREKAGIIKPGVPVVSARQEEEARTVIAEVAAEKGAPLHFIEDPIPDDLELGLAGPHQRWNAAVAVEALKRAGLAFAEDDVRTGLREVRWPGRFELVSERLVLDGAHNPAAAQQLAHAWRGHFGSEQATLILGILRDKDVVEITRALAPVAARIFTVPVANERSSPPQALAEIIRQTLDAPTVIPCSSLAAALDLARSHPERMLVCGSLFLVGQAKEFLARGGIA